MSGILQLINTFGPSGPFAVKNSLRLRSSASAYLSRTITLSATWTLSIWVKRGALGVTSPIFGGSVLFNSNDTLTAGTLTTTAVYRDPSAWYHIVVSNSGCYVNGISVGSTATGILVSPLIGSNAVNYFDGYLAEINLIDGQALTPSSFGAFDATSGVWQPVKYSGTYGTNGFYLKFSDTTSTTTLCYDYSGNGNNWTPNNISLTSGSTYDSMLDSPTNYDNGGTGVGNYAVFNPLLLWYTNAPAFTVSNGNLSVSESSATTWGSVATTIACPTSGKWYCEITATSVGAAKFAFIGITSTTSVAAIPGQVAGSYAYQADGTKWNNASSSSYGATYTSGDVIGIAYDADSATLTFYKNGTSQGTAFTSITAGSYYFVVGDYATTQSNVFDGNFGQRPFAYTPPTGFKALNTQNLPAASIVNGASFMAATLYTGTGANQSISDAVNGVSFQPDLVWTKARSAAIAGLMYDSVRGATKYIQTNSTAAEGTGADSLTAFNANGFSAGADTSTTGVNQNGTTYVGWQWKAGGTAVTNTAGSITSQVSANTTAGFSVATLTSQASGSGTFGHGLGVAPSMVITKIRTAATDWAVYHAGLTSAAYWIPLNKTDAQSTSINAWNNTAPTSSVVSLGPAYAGSYSIVAYCFAAIPGYSAFGSYTGNGSSDGPFVFTGFRPRWIMIKRSDNVSNWWILDTARNTYNVVGNYLEANLSDAEVNVSSTYPWDILSNGFKARASSAVNDSGATYIYAAFAENPLKYSLAR